MGDSHNEAEDIVADAIKLNSDDLNEKEQSAEKSSNFHHQNGNSLESATEDEPNYEVDDDEEIDEQAELRNEHDLEEENEQEETNNEELQNDTNHDAAAEQNETVEDDSAKTEEASVPTKKNGEEANDKSATDSAKKKSSENGEKSQSESKSGHAKGDSKEEHVNNKDSKKEASESDSKATATSKSKSSSTKDKEKEKSSEQKSSNDKTLWVSGLSSSARASDLQNLFKKHGKVIAAKIIKSSKGGSKYFGLITMASAEDAEKCIQHLNKTEFDGKTITVEKNKLVEEKKSEKETSSSDKKEKTGKETEKSSSKRDRSRSRSKSPKRRALSRSPIRRFPLPGHRPSYPPRRAPPPYHGSGFRGGFSSRPPPFAPAPFLSHGPPARDFEAMRRREMRLDEHRRAEEYRRQRDLERRQQEERDKLEREKMRLKIERERLEREKADFLRVEREKARLERERIEREREELRRKQAQLPSSSSRGLAEESRSKRYDDPFSSSWDKPRFSSNSTGLTGSDFRKLERDRSSLSSRERGSSHHRRDDDWKNSVTDRTRGFLGKSALAQPTQSAYLSSATRAPSSYERGALTDSWASAPDRIPPASSLNKFPPFAQVPSSIADRVRAAPSLAPQTMISSSIGMYQPSNPMGGLVSNPSVYGNNLNSGYRRY